MDKKERFSFRKYKVGLVSVLVGAVFLAAGAGRVSADELSKAAGVSQTDPASNIEQVVQATESSSTADFAQVASVEEATTEVSGVESTATASATADEVALASKTQETVSEELSSTRNIDMDITNSTRSTIEDSIGITIDLMEESLELNSNELNSNVMEKVSKSDVVEVSKNTPEKNIDSKVVNEVQVNNFTSMANNIHDYRDGGCVLWCNNRVKELLGITLPPTGISPSGVAGASNWWYTLSGYSKGNEPAKYALAIWRYTTVSGYENYGHVAFVEEVNGDTVTISQGGVYGAYWNGNLGVSYKNYSKSQVANIARTFLGYVYLKEKPVVAIKRYDVDKLSASVGQTISNGDYHIILASNPNYGLDVAAAASSNGTNIQVYQNVTTPEQVFSVSYLGDGYYKIIHKFTNKSIDVMNGSRDNNANVQLWDYNGSEAQQWILKANGLNNTFEIISRRSGLSLDVDGGKITNNTNVQMYEGNGTIAQQFKFLAVDYDAKRILADGVYHIVSAVDETMGLDVVGASNQNNTNVQIYPNLSDTNQTFKITYLNNGYYSITTNVSGKALDAAGNGSYNGTNVVIYSPNNSEAQQWIIKESNLEGFFEIISKNKNMALDVAGGVAKAGNNVQLYIRNGSIAQRWKFIPVHSTI
ncbi:signal peptide-containing protein, YSIRK family [Streptococcus gallolyticus]|uniref:Signal peptide-containing protein, YSIRK family n=1 Tax=Streptococcus gallolyticus TaxID=315405 RepID=A0A1I7HFB8_9STRE|nr:RICIN domain-containing protein [Streptococcus gallolyticus]SFC24982.1 signal peptide-containing protein, YSIRK family [Streptococcus gallolyticus]SFU59420.1 signal peptide-containing protein, YSIRK family [Streptococcus gallolyticus]